MRETRKVESKTVIPIIISFTIALVVFGAVLLWGGKGNQNITSQPAATDSSIVASDKGMVEGAKSKLPPPPNLDKKRPAPDFDNETWINSSPLKLADLKGKVTLVEFWTFGCYNCRNVQPALKHYYESYNAKGLEIVAFHDPEFDYEKNVDNVRNAVKEQGLKYPVAIDNDFKTWNKYFVRAWPTLYLVDKQGQIRFSHIGEGNYDVIESAIVALLNE